MDEVAKLEPVKVFCRIRPNDANDEECMSCIDERSLSIHDPRHKTEPKFDSVRHILYVSSAICGVVSQRRKRYGLYFVSTVVVPNGHNGFDIQTEAEAIMVRQRLDYSVNRTPVKGDVTLSSLKSRLVESSVVPISQQYLYAVFISFIEPLSLYEDGNRNTYVNGAVELEVKSPEEALQAFYRGQQRRRIGSTILNDESSRSHGIFSIRIVRTGYDQTYDEAIMDKNQLSVSQLCLVDLAGAERTCRSGTAGTRLKEASTINKSLMTLRQCIDVLRTNQASKLLNNPTVQQQIVPYRDCKLTRIFKSFFDGCGQVAMLVCVHPNLRAISETMQVLQFAVSSQQVSTVIPATPVNLDNGFSARSSGNSADLATINDSILEAIVKIESLDTRILETTSFITSTDLDEYISTCFGCDPVKGRRGSRPSHGSCGDTQHASACPLLSILQKRADERQQIRELLSRFTAKFDLFLDGVVRRAETDSNRALLDALEKSKVENLQMDSKIRCLENEVTRLRTLRSHERNEYDRELSESKAQIKKLKNQLTSLQLTCSTPRTRRDHRDSNSSTGTTGDAGSSRYNLRRAAGIPSTTNRVAVLSRQWESRVAKQMQDATPMRFRRKDKEGRLSMSRCRTEMALAEVSNRPPAMNPRHRRSRSVGDDQSIWLEHKEDHPAPLGTILSPTGINVRKSATKINLEDTLKATNYVLHHQTATPEGNVETKLYKGSIIPTAGGGSAVVFNDVEELRQVSPLSTNLRRSTRLSQKRKYDNGSDGDKENVVLETDEDGEVGNIPPSAKRRVAYPGKRASLLSSTSGVSTAAGQTDDDGDNKSYKTITPPSPGKYLGYSYTGGVSGGFKDRKLR
ncbi:hypothetical protein Aperf_G00000070362 [Anoplocephala perfoliata]